MHHVLVAAVAFVVGGFLAITAANAQTMNYVAGGPQRIDNMCKVYTGFRREMDNYGYYKPCADQAAGAPSRGAVAAASAEAAAPHYYYGGSAYAAAAAYDSEAAYCIQRFKSYHPGSGTYLGYDGKRHPCP